MNLHAKVVRHHQQPIDNIKVFHKQPARVGNVSWKQYHGEVTFGACSSHTSLTAANYVKPALLENRDQNAIQKIWTGADKALFQQPQRAWLDFLGRFYGADHAATWWTRQFTSYTPASSRSCNNRDQT